MCAVKTIWDAPREPALEVYLLGCVDFDASLFLQDRLANEIAGRADSGGALLLCEHPPLVTIGREGSRADVLASSEELRARQMEVRWLARGGGCFVHAPGQLAASPLIPLDRRGMGLTAFRDALALAVVDVCEELRVPAQPRAECPGVWCRGGLVGQVGVGVRSWITSHGLVLNVNPRPDILSLVRAGAERVTSLAAERRLPTAMPAVREALVRRLASRLGYERYHLHTGHPLLRRTRRALAYA